MHGGLGNLRKIRDVRETSIDNGKGMVRIKTAKIGNRARTDSFTPRMFNIVKK